MADVFISYAHQDADIAQAIAHELETRGYTTWRYEAKSLLGGSYLERIDREIEECRAALFVISAASLASPQCKSETVRAHELGKPLLPLRRDISHDALVQQSRTWSMALKGAVTAAVTLETAAAMAGEAASVLKEQGIRPGEPTAARPSRPITLPPPAAKATPIGAWVAAAFATLGLPYCLLHLSRALSPDARTPEGWVLATFSGFRTATTFVNLAGIAQNSLFLYGAWLAYRRDARAPALMRKVALSVFATVGLWLVVSLMSFSAGAAAIPDPANRGALVQGTITAAIVAVAPSAIVFALFRRKGATTSS